MDAIASALRDTGLTLVLFNTPVPDWDDGGRGVAALPGLEARFRNQFEIALGYADALAPAHIHVMSGLSQGRAAFDCLVRNLSWAARHAPACQLTIEPINRVDMPGYFLNDFDIARDVIEAVGAPNLALQFDAYHGQHLHGDVSALWHAFGPITAHVQVAGFPGRHEPLAAVIDYPAFFARLDADGYDGFVGCEYHPARGTLDGLGWMPHRRAAAGA